MKDFFDEIIERGVIGLAIGFILAQLIMQVIGLILGVFIMPLIALVTSGKGFAIINLTIGTTTFPFGEILNQGISILITLLVIKYLLGKLKKENKVV